MDKLKNGRTITIKINGNERKFKEESRIPQKETNKEIVDSPPTIELEGLSEVAAAEQAAEESFDWILPEAEEKEIEEYIIAQPSKEKKKNSISVLRNQMQKKQHAGPAKSIFFSVLLAIIIGTSFGFLVLKLVISDGQIKDKSVTALQEEAITENGDTKGTSKSLVLQPIDTFIVQGGVFSSVDSAKIEEQKLKEKGVATQIIEANGQAILVLGIADTIDKAKGIGNVLKEKEIEVFAKPYTLPEKDLNDLTEVEGQLLKQVGTVYQTLVSLSSSGIKADENELQKQMSFLQTIDRKEIKSLKIEKLLVELEGAITKLEAFNQDEAQQHLLTFMGTYFSL